MGISDTPQNALIATTVVFVLGPDVRFLGIAAQQRLADYYIQVHLFFLKGEKGSELDSSVRQQEIYDQMDEKTPKYERIFQKSYIDYTKKQEDVTPSVSASDEKHPREIWRSDQLPQNIREEIHRESLALMPWNGLVTFNFRSFWLFVFILIDLPAEFFILEIFAMGLLTEYVRRRHEGFCSRIADKLDKERYKQPVFHHWCSSRCGDDADFRCQFHRIVASSLSCRLTGLFPIFGIWIIIYGINALAWMEIIKCQLNEGENVSFWRIFRLTITGYALNYATPVGGPEGAIPYSRIVKGLGNQRAASSVLLLCDDAYLCRLLAVVHHHIPLSRTCCHR